MSGAPLPAPQYITYIDNVLPYVGSDKISVGDEFTTQIPTGLADQLVAEGEALALQDLSLYYVVVPNLVTTTGNPWTTLPQMTYNTLYYMFVTQAAMKLIGNFIARNTDDQKATLSYFQKFYEAEYNKILNRIREKLPNGSYAYQLIGLEPLLNGIPRRTNVYARSGAMGSGCCNNYVDGQMTNPQKNFSGVGPNGYRGAIG